MSAPHGVVIRAHPRHEGALVEAIRASDEDLEVVRRCADMAEVSAAARSGRERRPAARLPDMTRRTILFHSGASATGSASAPTARASAAPARPCAR